ncbi:MAG: hypothetical protein WCV92_00730 [Candidatus Buchananbacteria bacterium]|jgi:hypothetical protein
MSFEVTHIHFAVDLKEHYQIKDIKSYILGSIYPDSRYITKVDRELAHSKESLSDSFIDSDFKKGWQAHCVCDSIYDRLETELFGEFDDAILRNAIKIVADIYDRQSFNVQK